MRARLIVIALILCLASTGVWAAASIRSHQYTTGETNGNGWSWTLKNLTSGIGAEYVANTMTTGDLLRLTLDDDALDATGAYISCLGGTAHNTEVWKVGEGGIVTYKGGATVDNSTSATVLNLTETTIRATGILDVTGNSTLASVDVGGGSGGTGATISAAGAGTFDAALTADSLVVGGGYASTGLSVANTGAVTGASTALFDSTITSGKAGSAGSVVAYGTTSGSLALTPIADGTNLTTIQNQTGGSAKVITLPAATCTLPGLGLANVWTATNTFGADTTGTDLQLYTDTTSCNVLWDASDQRLEGSGEVSILIGETTTGVNNASPNPMIYGRLASKTTAVTGDGIGVRGNARTYIASPAGSFYGGYFQAGSGSSASGSDGVDINLGVGALCEFVSTTPAAATTTVADARGLYVSLDVNQDAVDFTQLYGIKVNAQTDAGGTMGTYSASRLLYLENEAVGGEGGAGTGAQMDDAIYIKSTNLSGGIKGFNHGIDFSGATFNAAGAEINLSNSETIDNLTDGVLNLAATTVRATGALDVTGGFTTDTNAFAIADTTGVVTMLNGATIDNNADAAILNLTETTVRATGILDVTGNSTLASLDVGGGSGGSGATITTAGAATFDGAVTATGTLTSGTTVTTSGNGAIVADKCTVVEGGTSPIHQSVATFTLTGANDIDVADGGKTAGVKFYDLPEGRILVLGCTINASITTNAAYNADAADVYYVGIGTGDGTQAADADLTGTEQDIIPKTTIQTDTGGGANTVLTSDWHSQLATSAQWDGTSSAVDLYVNVAVPDASNTGATTHAITGTITLSWVNLGDY